MGEHNRAGLHWGSGSFLVSLRKSAFPHWWKGWEPVHPRPLRLPMGFHTSSSPTTMAATLWREVSRKQDDPRARGIEERGRTGAKGKYHSISRACHRGSGQLGSLGDRNWRCVTGIYMLFLDALFQFKMISNISESPQETDSCFCKGIRQSIGPFF